jgi:predicted protein tyrosine phosphatase
MTLIVCPLHQIETVIAERRPSHLITLLDPYALIETPAGVARERHLKLGVWDVSEPFGGLTPPEEADVLRILKFARAWDERAPLLVHCHAGISRSTATAFMLACERNPDIPEAEIAWSLRRAAPHAYPNRAIVRLADDILGRRGRMADAVEAIGPSNFAVLGTAFDLPARF